MIAIVAMLAAHATSPADWFCAMPLIEKNALRAIDARQLALRISDECAVPFKLNSDDPVWATDRNVRSLYTVELTLFRQEIEAEINKKRRAQAIPLQR